jgi:hypothetical protein
MIEKKKKISGVYNRKKYRINSKKKSRRKKYKRTKREVAFL